MTSARWARFDGSVECHLRRGAWYRVAVLTRDEALLDINRRQVSVPRDSLKIVSKLPRAWTIVPRPLHAKGLPTLWGDRYAVCPACRNRARVMGAPQSMHCGRCNRLFRVAWEEWSGATG